MSTAALDATVHTASRPRPLADALPTWAWLAIGVAVTALGANRFSVPLLGWVMAVPWLVVLRRTDGWWGRLALLAAMQVGMALQIAKIITDPLPWAFVPMFSVPMGLSAWVLYLGFEGARRRLGDGWGLALFPALATVAEWVGWRTSDFGSWGAAAYTQLDNLALLQTTSVLGLGGIAWLTAACSALIALGLVDARPGRWLPHAGGLALLVGLAHGFGAWRLQQPLDGPRVTVAAVMTDLGLDGGELPSDEALDAATDRLFARTEQAIDAGAELVVWNEGATAVQPDREAALIARGQALATDRGVDLVLAWVVPLDGMAHYENKYVWLTPTGPIETYFKHFPVPGEGAVRGTSPIQVHDRPYGPAAGAICYDYDFPQLGLEHGRKGAGLVVVPSSDWAGIDPTHTWMARVRGIESGFSVVRPVRWATSGAFDAYGRTLAALPWSDDGHVMLARVPTTPRPTVYQRVGDVLPWSCLGVLGLGLLAWARRIRASRRP